MRRQFHFALIFYNIHPHCQTNELTKIPFSTRKTGIIADGSYRIFGITDQNHIVDLSDCISIEQSATKSEGDFINPLGY